MMKYVEALEARQQFSATFGSDGVAVLTFRRANASDVVNVEQVLPDPAGTGAYVVASTNTTLQVQRVTAAGTLDTGWGKGGTLVFTHRAKSSGAAKVLAGGDRLYVVLGGELIRYTDAGRLDKAYGSGGIVKLTAFNAVNDFTVDSGNHVLVTGSAGVGTKNVGSQLRVERFTSRGRRDTAFDRDGIYDLPFVKAATGSRAATSTGQFVRALADGGVVAAGVERLGSTAQRGVYTTTATRAVRFAANGSLVKNYGTGGIATSYQPGDTALTAYDTELQGIRTTGQPVLYATSLALAVGGSTTQADSQFQAGGTGLDPLGPTTAYAGADFGPSLTASQDLAVLDDRYVAVLGRSGTVDPGFNDGQPLLVGPADEHAAAPHVALAAIQTRAGQRLLTAANTHGANRVTLALYTPQGDHADR